MPQIQSDLEWQAIQLFLEERKKKQPNPSVGTIIKKSMINRQNLTIFSAQNAEGKSIKVKLKHDYIIGPLGKPYRVVKKLGAGTQAIGWLASDSDHNLFVIKELHSKEQVDAGILMSENLILDDLSLSQEGLFDAMSYSGEALIESSFIVLHYKGDSYTKHLSSRLSFSQKLDLAINTAKAVDDLNTGVLSKRKKEYIHSDIKPDNLVVDVHGRVHLIDFGGSQPLRENATRLVSTPEYTPINSSTEMNPYAWDGFSLLRVLYMPSKIKILTESGEYSEKERKYRSVFNDEEVRSNPALMALLDTSDNLSKEMNSTEILVRLILIKYDLLDFFQDLKNAQKIKHFKKWFFSVNKESRETSRAFLLKDLSEPIKDRIKNIISVITSNDNRFVKLSEADSALCKTQDQQRQLTISFNAVKAAEANYHKSLVMTDDPTEKWHAKSKFILEKLRYRKLIYQIRVQNNASYSPTDFFKNPNHSSANKLAQTKTMIDFFEKLIFNPHQDAETFESIKDKMNGELGKLYDEIEGQIRTKQLASRDEGHRDESSENDESSLHPLK